MKMRSKAISSMIATVLLIAFTVAVGGILSMWLTGLASTQTETTGSAANAQVLCGRTALNIKEVTFNNTANVNYATVTLSYNYGTENLYNFSLTFIDSNRVSFTVPAASLAGQGNATAQYNTTYPLAPGMLQSWTLNITSYYGPSGPFTSTSLKTVKVVALCQGTYPVSAECDSGQSCMA
ncbi:MAG: hypothetical protein NT016_01825 [Candidatus Aenigmarchaeota archaeon]|nr:hypothetical protein [Candidatus Aenigmarchaeota archaeon]